MMAFGLRMAVGWCSSLFKPTLILLLSFHPASEDDNFKDYSDKLKILKSIPKFLFKFL